MILSGGLACALGSGCAGELEHPEKFAFLAGDGGLGGDGGGQNHPAPPSCVTDFFDLRCSSSVCHGEGTTQINLVSAGVQNRLIDQPSSETGECGGRTLVSTSGEGSLLMEKLTDPTCGVKMPLVGTATADEIACVQAWVETLGGVGAGEDGGT